MKKKGNRANFLEGEHSFNSERVGKVRHIKTALKGKAKRLNLWTLRMETNCLRLMIGRVLKLSVQEPFAALPYD